MARAVGIEINDSRVKILTVDSTAKTTRIVGYHEESIPIDPAKPWEEAAQETVRKAFLASKAGKSRVVASIDSGDAILRDVTLPFKDEDKIRKTVYAEVESLIHNYTIEDLVIDYFKTGETEKGTVLMTAAVPKAVVEKRLRLLAPSGVDPVALDLDVAALFNTFLNTGAIDSDDPLLILYGTPKYTKILLVEKKRPASIRTIRFSLPTKEAIAKEKEERKQAAMWETREAGHDVPIVVLDDSDHAKFSDLDEESQHSLIHILSKEISRFLLANAASATPAQILLSGEYETQEAAQLLEAATQIPVRTHNILEVIEHPFPKPDPEISAKLAVPLGLALKGCDVDALKLDFRKDRFSYAKKYEVIKTTALVTVELVIVLLATIALHFYFKARDLRHLERQVMEYQLDLYKLTLSDEEVRVFEKDEPDAKSKEREPFLREVYPKMQQYTSRVRRDLGDEHPLRDSALEVWRLVGEAIQAWFDSNRTAPPAKLGDAEIYLYIDKISVGYSGVAGKLRLDVVILGKVGATAQAELLKDALAAYRPAGKSPLFTKAWFSGSFPEKDGKKQFTLNLQGDPK